MSVNLFLLGFTDKEGLPIRPIFISVDPDRDNVSQMRFYAQGEHTSMDLTSDHGLRHDGADVMRRLHGQISIRVSCT